MQKFKITYLSGQSVIVIGETLEQVAKLAEQDIAWLRKGRPHVGIKSVEVAK
jgi:uncharacterized RmlC-like cupin family protein